MIQFLINIYKKEPKTIQTPKDHNQVYVTMDWGGNPITTKGDGYILPRDAEMIINKKYYPNSKVGEWPCDPITGEKLPIWKS